MLKLSSLFYSGTAAMTGLVLIGAISANAQNAQSAKPPAVDPNFVSSAFPEIETENLFGFTEGSDIGQPGEKELEWETETSAKKRDGKYFSAEHHLAYGYNPNDRMHLEIALAGVTTDIKNVTLPEPFDNKRFTGLSGVSTEFKYLILNRGPGSPIGLTFAFEPQFSWIDDGDGSKVRSFSAETRLQADMELIPNRLYLGSNIIYEPEVVHPKNGDPTEHESSLAITGALSYRFLPKLALGAEVQYMRAYDQGIGLNHFTGDATYVGPSLFWQIAPKNTLTLAWGRQVRGNSSETPNDRLNLVDFSRDIGKLKYEHEF
jgi:Putative MetA-pathway of phenol degradation